MNQYIILRKFEAYLEAQGYSTITPSGLPSTTNDYAQKRIPFILKNEGINIQTLVNNIENYVTEYDFGGTKENFGNMSHRAVINALRRFKEFIDFDTNLFD